MWQSWLYRRNGLTEFLVPFVTNDTMKKNTALIEAVLAKQQIPTFKEFSRQTGRTVRRSFLLPAAVDKIDKPYTNSVADFTLSPFQQRLRARNGVPMQRLEHFRYNPKTKYIIVGGIWFSALQGDTQYEMRATPTEYLNVLHSLMHALRKHAGATLPVHINNAYNCIDNALNELNRDDFPIVRELAAHASFRIELRLAALFVYSILDLSNLGQMDSDQILFHKKFLEAVENDKRWLRPERVPRIEHASAPTNDALTSTSERAELETTLAEDTFLQFLKLKVF